MPELPEVTTVVKVIKPKILNKTILGINIFTPKIVKSDSVDNFQKKVKNQKINKVFNKAKYIVLELDEHVIISHLRMTGKWVVEQAETYSYDRSWLRAEISLDDQKFFRFYDARGFGTLDIYDKKDYQIVSGLDQLGPIPLNNQVSVDYLYSKTQKTNRAIKTLLLDQHIIAGLGNIYVNEVLFLSKVLPDKPAKLLSRSQVEDIINNSEQVLQKAIAMNGTTISDFESLPGVKGEYQNELLVHLRNNKKCKHCGSKILKTQVNNRGTYYCSVCQS
ncbi:DNA-formamidopyrimidine glycosylase [Mycoplasma putrefaciens]|uniref:Formamidopyrimidine-DNA glycosylase n=1 Tax=Mycoplasma putrefaciens Mput9231 TaxID=1292033 RepID=M9WCT9_9MOLU|nr:DNA-formamidopyrimidine glycosylase [Mycoplasma putrefaciens]AGJ90947.1 Formamidopyrimidine-DNA glycosylase [Mycoplasma putrefaciens Mput9231]